MHLNISQADPDATLRQVQDRIDGESLVMHALGPDGVEGVVHAHVRREERPQAFTLDLIAHARRGVLQLGAWTVDGVGACETLQRSCAGVLAPGELRAIRLLGCNTALTEAGQTAIRRLHRLFDVPVYGSKVPLTARDFDRTGFRSDGVLTYQDHLPPVEPPALQNATGWRDRFEAVPGQDAPGDSHPLKSENLTEALRDWKRTIPALRWPVRQLERAQFDAIVRSAEPVPAWAPGLLALPELEILAPASDGEQRFHRLTVLLDGFWLRIYPRGLDEGVVVRADGDERLFDALAQGTEISMS